MQVANAFYFSTKKAQENVESGTSMTRDYNRLPKALVT